MKNANGAKAILTVLAGGAAFAAFAAAGPSTTLLEGVRVRVVRSGETVETPGSGGTTGTVNYNNTPPAGDPYEGSRCAVLLEDGAKITITNGTAFWPMIVMTNGTATIETPSTSLSFNRSILLRGGARLTVDGPDLVYVGFGHENFIPYYELDGMSITKNGEDVTHLLCMNHAARIVSMPEKWVEDFQPGSYDVGTVYFLSDVYAGKTVVSNFPNSNVYFASPDFINGKTVRPRFRSTLHLTPFSIVGKRETLSEHLEAVNAVEQLETDISFDHPGTNYSFDVEFTDRRSAIVIDVLSSGSKTVGSSFSGKVSGVGMVAARFGEGATAEFPKTAVVSGDFSEFTGSVSNSCANVNMTTRNDIPFGIMVISNDLPLATVKVDRHVQVIFCPEEESLEVLSVNGMSAGAFLGVDEGKSVDIGELSGSISAVSGGGIVCGAVAPSTTLVNDGAVTLPSVSGAVAFDADGNVIARRFPDETGVSADAGAFAAALKGSVGYRAIGATAGIILTNVSSDVVLDSGTAPVVDASSGNVSLCGSGTMSFDRGGRSDWTNSVGYWFDFSDTRWLRGVSHDADVPDTAKLSATVGYGGRNCPVFERCVDWRYPDREASLWQSLYYSDANSANAHTLYPIAATNMYPHAPGLGYMTFGDRTSSRLPFGFTRTTANNGEPLSAQYVVMVYGSGLGGGDSLVADGEELFRRKRKGSDGVLHPFVSTNSLPEGVEIRADGVKIEKPWETCPKGGWQVVTLKMNGKGFRGLGFYGTDKVKGNGQSEYGEVLVFTDEVDLAYVMQAERYLARKWNLPYDDTDLKAAERHINAASTNTVSGVGSSGARIKAGYATLRVEGDFAGEIALDGGRLLVDAALPWSEERVAAVGDRCFWLDGDDDSSIVYTSSPNYSGDEISRSQVRAVKDKYDPDFRTGPLMAGISNRMPYRRKEAKRFGVERGWLDFHEWRRETVSGNVLRMIQPYRGESWESVANDPYLMSVQTILMAHDSTWGGGMPVCDTPGGNGRIKWRTTTNPAEPVWKAGMSSAKGCDEFRYGLNRLDGVTQANPNGFGGKPEVFTVRGTDPIEAQYHIDIYQNSETEDTFDNRRAACVGEVLYFTRGLEDSEITGIESYLMGKWLGILPAGFGDVRNATVTGSGTVEVSDISKMPNIASGFDGTVRVAGESGELRMTVDASTRKVHGALVNGSAVFELPATVTVLVEFTDVPERRSPYRYTLVDIASGDTAWTVELAAGAPDNVAVVRENGRIFLDVKVRGMTLTVR